MQADSPARPSSALKPRLEFYNFFGFLLLKSPGVRTGALLVGFFFKSINQMLVVGDEGLEPPTSSLSL